MRKFLSIFEETLIMFWTVFFTIVMVIGSCEEAKVM